MGLLEQMVADGVKPDLKTVTQILDSLPSDTQTVEVRTKEACSGGSRG